MKFVVCRNCGNAMNGAGGISSCRRCHQSDLEYHDLYYDANSVDLSKRLDAISAPYKKEHPSPIWGLLTVLVIAGSAAGWQEITLRPSGEFARQAIAVASTAPALGSSKSSKALQSNQKSLSL